MIGCILTKVIQTNAHDQWRQEFGNFALAAATADHGAETGAETANSTVAESAVGGIGGAGARPSAQRFWLPGLEALCHFQVL